MDSKLDLSKMDSCLDGKNQATWFPSRTLGLILVGIGKEGEVPNETGCSPAPSTEFLRQYFNFGYLFGLFPYKYKYDLGKSVFIIETSRVRRIVSVCLQCLVMYKICTLIHQELGDGELITHLNFIGSALAACYKFLFLATFWKRKDAFLHLFNSINEFQDKKEVCTKNCKRMSRLKCAAIALCILLLVPPIVCTLTGNTNLNPTNMTAAAYVKWFANSLRVMLYMKKKGPSTRGGAGLATPDNPPLELSLSHLSSSDYFAGAFQFMVTFYWQLNSFYSDFSFLVYAITFKMLTRDFMSRTDRPPFKYTTILQGYTTLKGIVDQISSIGGLILLFCLLEEVVYYIIFIGQLLTENNWLLQLRYLIFLVMLLATLFVAANAAHEIRGLEDWLGTGSNTYYVTGAKLAILISELNKHRVGISALGLFTVTYGFIGTTIGLILTYGVVCLQLQMKPS